MLITFQGERYTFSTFLRICGVYFFSGIAAGLMLTGIVAVVCVLEARNMWRSIDAPRERTRTDGP